MKTSRGLAFGAVGLAAVAAARGQSQVPLGDRLEPPLIPAGISEQDMAIHGALAYLYKLDDGTDVMHVVGDFTLRPGETGGQRLEARQGIVWMTAGNHEGRPFRRLLVYLRDSARVTEAAGTVTEGPVLFVTLATYGRIVMHADDVAFQSSTESRAYIEGDAVRRALLSRPPAAPMDESAVRIVSPVPSRDGVEEIPAQVYFRADRTLGPETVDGRRVVYAIGNVRAFRGKPGTDRYIELRADAAVVFLPPEEPGPSLPSPVGRSPLRDESPDARQEALPDGRGSAQEAPPDGGGSAQETRPEGDVFAQAGGDVEAVYLEGDIIVSRGLHAIRAARLYYDFVDDKALILDAVVRTQVPERNLPLYFRAAEIRQLSERTYAADRALITTSEFRTPHYHIGAERIELTDRTPAAFSGSRQAPTSGTFTLRDATFNVSGVPLAWWPVIRGDVSEGETSIKSVRVGYSDDFGMELETRWRLFNLLGLQTPEGFDSTLRLDYFSERGPGAGVDLDYQRDDYFGEFLGYALYDQGEDNLGGIRHGIEPDSSSRGRLLLRHRHFLPNDWQLTLETSYISDDTFLEEFYEKEFDTGKEQETLAYLKKQVDNWAFTSHLQWRILDFTTQTERLPDFSFRLIGEPIGERGLTWFSENRAGWVRYRARELEGLEKLLTRHVDSSGTVSRGDTRQEFEYPVDLGPVRLSPFTSLRGSAWDDSPDEGGVGRAFGAYGVRGSMYFWRLYDAVRSEFWNIDGIRHIIKPDVVAWASHTNQDSRDLFMFDQDVEGIDEFDGVTVGVRQRWQTKRGAGESRRVVDWVTWNVEAGAFNDAGGAAGAARTNGYTSFTRPENSIARNYVGSSFIWRINDATAFVSDANFDLNDGELDVFNASMVVERSPRLSYLVGYRFIEDSNSNLVGFGANYRLNEKYALALREEFDLDEGKTSDFTIGVVRRSPRWVTILALDFDEGEDDVGVTMSLAPEGLTNATLGSRRFTGLAESMRIEPD